MSWETYSARCRENHVHTVCAPSYNSSSVPSVAHSKHFPCGEYSRIRHSVYFCQMLHTSFLKMNIHAWSTTQLTMEDLSTAFKTRELDCIEVTRCMKRSEMYGF